MTLYLVLWTVGWGCDLFSWFRLGTLDTWLRSGLQTPITILLWLCLLKCDLQSFKWLCRANIPSNDPGKVLQKKLENLILLEAEGSTTENEEFGKSNYGHLVCNYDSSHSREGLDGAHTQVLNQWAILPLRQQSDQKGTEERNCPLPHSVWTLETTITPTVYINILCYSSVFIAYFCSSGHLLSRQMVWLFITGTSWQTQWLFNMSKIHL